MAKKKTKEKEQFNSERIANLKLNNKNIISFWKRDAVALYDRCGETLGCIEKTLDACIPDDHPVRRKKRVQENAKKNIDEEYFE